MTAFQLDHRQDLLTGRKYRSIGRANADVGHAYFTAMSWTTDSQSLVLWSSEDEDERCKGAYYKVDTQHGEAVKVGSDLPWGRQLVGSDDRVYFYEGREIWSVSPQGDDRRTIGILPEGAVCYGPLSITNDASLLGIYWLAEETWVIGTLEIESGLVREIARPSFAAPHPIANHAMINPEWPNQLFYAHEGKTEQIADRIHYVDTVSGPFGAAYEQPILPDGRLGAYVGHEMWQYDGAYLLFVRYSHSPAGQTGVYRLPRSGGEAQWINGDYPYWHVSASPDGRWAVADTMELDDEGEPITRMVLIDLAVGRSQLLVQQRRWTDHPGHPHPSFSPDSCQISFTFSDESRRLRVGVLTLLPSDRSGGD